MNISNSLSLFLKSIQSSHSEHIVLQTLMYPVTPLWQVFCKLSSIAIGYPSIGFTASSLTFLVIISSSCRPPSHHTALWKFHYSPFLAKCILLEMCLVCLVYLTFLAMQIANFLSNIIRGACSGTTSVSIFNNSLLTGNVWSVV